RQGVSAGGRVEARMGDRSALQPGSMISVALMSGDLNIAADGTVTHIDQDRIYAFGHRFLAIGPTDLPFARSEVLTLLPNLASYAVRGQIEFHGGAPPLKLNNMYAGDANTAMQVSLSAAIPLAYVLQSEFSSLVVKKVALDIDSFDEKKQFQIDQVIVSPHEV